MRDTVSCFPNLSDRAGTLILWLLWFGYRAERSDAGWRFSTGLMPDSWRPIDDADLEWAFERGFVTKEYGRLVLTAVGQGQLCN